jgi:hypothetical protein
MFRTRFRQAQDRRTWLTATTLRLFAFLALSLLNPTIGRGQQVWFSMRGMAQDWKGVHGFADWEKLFLNSDAQWPATLAGVAVLQVTTQTLERIPENDLIKVVNRLHALKVPMGVEMLAQNYEGNCGKNVEGFTSPQQTSAVAARLKRAGGELEYAAMDGPLWSGHYRRGEGSCLSPPSDVAQRVAANVREYVRLFPQLIVGDIEPIPDLTAQPDWVEVYRLWMTAFQAHNGRPLAFLRLDIDWDRNGWQEGIRAAAQFSRKANLPLGIIYNASPHAVDDSEWLARASHHMAEVEGKLGIIPQQAVFESWVRFPTRGIGDAAVPGYDSLVSTYVEQHRSR